MLLGVLSRHLEIDERHWLDAIRAAFPEKLHAANLQAFALGRKGAWPMNQTERHPVSAPDFMPVSALRATQLSRLQRMVGRAYDMCRCFTNAWTIAA